MEFLLNVLFAVLAFFVTRWVGAQIAPEGQDTPKIVVIIAIIVAVLVFFADLASKVV